MLRFSRVCVCCAENSETQLGKDVKYKLLVRAIRRGTEEELGQLVSASFTVRDLRCSLVLLWGVCTAHASPHHLLGTVLICLRLIWRRAASTGINLSSLVQHKNLSMLPCNRVCLKYILPVHVRNPDVLSGGDNEIQGKCEVFHPLPD